MVKKKKTQGQINKYNYIKDFDKKTYKMIAFKVRRDDVEIIDKLNKETNKSAYIINLIREDIKKEG